MRYVEVAHQFMSNGETHCRWQKHDIGVININGGSVFLEGPFTLITFVAEMLPLFLTLAVIEIYSLSYT